MTSRSLRANSSDAPGTGRRSHLVTIALATIVVLVLGGLWAIDRALTRSRRTETALQAVEIASIVEAFFSSAASTLAAVRAGMTGDDSIPRAFDRVAGAMLEVEGPFAALWLADANGGVLEWREPAGIRAAPVAEIGSWPGMQDVLQRARQLPAIQSLPLVVAIGRDTGILLVGAARAAAGRPAFIGGVVPVERLTGAITRRHPQLPLHLRLEADGHGVIELGARRDTRRLYRAAATVDLEGTQGWRVVVGQPPARSEARVALWAIGAAAVVGLFVGVLQERRQAQRLADRSLELERLSIELLNANRAKSEFLANVSHELRTPLTAIVGFVDLLRDGVYGELAPRQVGPVDRIASSANHLRHLVDQVLDIAKMAAGRLEVHAEPIALRPFVLDVVSDIEPLMAEKGLALAIAVSGALPKVRTDPVHLRQILMNLVGNAVRYTPKGSVSVRARVVLPERGEDATLPAGLDAAWPWSALQVSDTGIGIERADQARIFDEFEQVEPGSRGHSATRGTGLGLSISRRLARLLGGDITVESTPGAGSTFTLWLPVHPSDVPDQAAPEQPGAPGTPVPPE